jgi:hypothetical protein
MGNPVDEILKIDPAEAVSSTMHSEAMLKSLLWEQAKQNVPFYIIGKSNRKRWAEKDFDRLLNLSQCFLDHRVEQADKVI